MSTLGEHQGNGIRYTVHLSSQGGAIVQMLRRDDGGWVAWNEYASLQAELTNCQAEADRLKAEVERLRASSFVTAVPVEQYERVIKAGDVMVEHIRLREAGDEMAEWLGREWCPSWLVKDWLAAKEGSQP